MSSDAVGGMWTYTLEIARELAGCGVTVRIAVLGPTPSEIQRGQAREIPGVQLAETELALDWTARTEEELQQVADGLKQHALAFGADLVHLNAPAHAGLTHWPMPVVVAAHSCVATWWRALHSASLPADLAWRARRTAAGLGIADAILAPSHSFACALRETYGMALDIRAVHNARKLPERPLARRAECILTAGRLWDPAKNVAIIDEAASLSGLRIHAAGQLFSPNGERASFHHLDLLGSLGESELTSWYQRAAIFVSLSRYEPFGLSVLEAAQSGAALVLSDISTFRELWDGAACFVPAQNASALADALVRFRSDPRARQDLAARAQRRARNYSPRRMLRETLDAYQFARRSYVERKSARSAA